MRITLNGNELELTDDQVKKIVNEYKPVEEKKLGIAIKSRYSSVSIIFQSTKSTIKDAVIEAVENGADLSGADLSGADLYNAKFYGKGGTKTLKREQLPDFLSALGFVIED